MKTNVPMQTQRWKARSGPTVLLEESHALPLVDFEFTLLTGSEHDPVGKEGLTRLTWRVFRMGPKAVRNSTLRSPALTSAEVEDRIASLGARLSVQVSTSYVRVQGIVIRRNLDEFFALLCHMLINPAFRAVDLARAKREVIAQLKANRDDDGALASREFRRALFPKHPYGRPVTGEIPAVRSIRTVDLKELHKKHVCAKNIVLAVAGDVDRTTVERLCDKHLAGLPGGAAPKKKLRSPTATKGRRIVLIDKPERTQARILIGGIGAKVKDPLLTPLTIGNTAFGGMFTSRLTQEVREERGWSYGASSHLGTDRERDAWYMSTAPATDDAAACIALQLELYDAYLRRGVTAKEFRRAKDYITNSYCFEMDTAVKRLEPRIDEEIFGLPFASLSKYLAKVRQTKRADVNSAVSRRMPRDLTIALVSTADRILPALQRLPGISDVRVVPYTRVL